MDLHVPPSLLGRRLRPQRVSRRLDVARFGTSTRNHHRTSRLQDFAFIALLVLSAVGGVLLLAA